MRIVQSTDKDTNMQDRLMPLPPGDKALVADLVLDREANTLEDWLLDASDSGISNDAIAEQLTAKIGRDDCRISREAVRRWIGHYRDQVAAA